MTHLKYKQQGLCSRKSSNVCLILFDDGSRQLSHEVKALLDYYTNDPISFVYVDKFSESDLHKQFGNSAYHMVAYKPKRSKYLGYKNPDFS